MRLPDIPVGAWSHTCGGFFFDEDLRCVGLSDVLEEGVVDGALDQHLDLLLTP